MYVDQVLIANHTCVYNYTWLETTIIKPLPAIASDEK